MNWQPGDRVRVLSCPARRDLEGRTGWVVNRPAVGRNSVLRVRLDGSVWGNWTEIDGTADKFERERP